jgi:putative oxidoreductase
VREAAGLLMLRLAAGGLLLPHGLGKLLGWFGGPGLDGFAAELAAFGLPSGWGLPLGLALVQVLAGALIVLGLWARAAALAAAGFLAVTVVLAVPNGWFWMSRGVEYPLLWTCACLVIAMLGPGTWSLDPPRAAATPVRGHA